MATTPAGPVRCGDEPSGQSVADEVVAEVALTGGAAEVTALIYPVVRTADAAVLTFELESPQGDEVFLGTQFAVVVSPQVRSPGAIRLADLEAEQIYLPATDSAGELVGPTGYTTVEPDGTTIQIAYALPSDESDQLAVLLAGSPLMDNIPVTEAVPLTVEDPAGLSDIAKAPVVSLGSFAAQLDDAVGTLSDQEQVEITLGLMCYLILDPLTWIPQPSKS